MSSPGEVIKDALRCHRRVLGDEIDDPFEILGGRGLS
jgi:hypothetical protein